MVGRKEFKRRRQESSYRNRETKKGNDWANSKLTLSIGHQSVIFRTSVNDCSQSDSKCKGGGGEKTDWSDDGPSKLWLGSHHSIDGCKPEVLDEAVKEVEIWSWCQFHDYSEEVFCPRLELDSRHYHTVERIRVSILKSLFSARERWSPGID